MIRFVSQATVYCIAALAVLGCSLIASVDESRIDDPDGPADAIGGMGGAHESACSQDGDCPDDYFCSDERDCQYCAPGSSCSEFALDGPLQEPEQAIAFVRDSADFWIAARDDERGGFHSYVAEDGSPVLDAEGDPLAKSIVGQSRLAYGFARAFMLTGELEYLELAEHALDFVYQHGWDEQDDGFYFFTSADGSEPITDGASAKWSYFQHYGLLGPTTMCEATSAARHCDWMHKGISSLQEHLWDDRPGLEGYFDQANDDFSIVSGKGFTPTADAITTHALAAYLITQRKDYRGRFLALADQLVDHLVASREDPDVVFGFAEQFSSDWERSSDTFGFVGHVYKAAWSLARAYLVEPKESYRWAAEELMLHLYEDGGFDRNVGAPNNGFHWDEGLESETKDYWQVEQGFTAGITNFYVAERSGSDTAARHLEVGSRSLDFMLSKMVDAKYGEIFSVMSADGQQVIDRTKGGRWKAGYHSIETGYLAYLYGSLLVHRRPVHLHYLVQPSGQGRQLSLLPLAFARDELLIEAVTLDGVDYRAFEATTRTIDVPAGRGGIFRVTFAPRPTSAALTRR